MGTFLSRDPVESEPPYSYVNGNPINFVDPSGYFKCDPLTGQCEAGYGLCVVQGVWRGAYVNGKPCIVNPNNVQTGNAPSWPAPTPRLTTPPPRLALPPLPSSSLCEACDPNNEPATRWLINMMVHNAVSPVANQIRDYNHAGVGPINQIPVLPVQLLGRYAAYQTWIDMVKTGADWDYKLPIFYRRPGFE